MDSMIIQSRKFVRKEWALASIGFVEIGLALTILTVPVTPLDSSHALFHQYLPRELRGAIWLALALFTLITTFTRKERWGWAAATVMPAMQTISYGWSILMILIPGWPPGTITAIPYFFVWGGLTLLIMILSGWPDLQRQIVATK